MLGCHACCNVDHVSFTRLQARVLQVRDAQPRSKAHSASFMMTGRHRYLWQQCPAFHAPLEKRNRGWLESVCLCRSFAKDVVPQVNETIEFARANDIPIIYTLHGENKRRTADAVSGLMRELLAPDYVFM